ncbi:MAG: 6-pyruvoyl-tetrahydropterin synthase-related protein [Anaerolineae bacterium]
MKEKVRRFDPGWLAVVGISVFAWAALLAPGYFLNAHDARHTLFFLNNFDQAIREGIWIPRWAPDFALGYGYPLFILYSPLAYYVAEVFHLLGANLTDAVKWTFGVAFLLSGWGMYGFGRRLFGRAGGLVGATAYLYAPYHLLDIYVRGSLAEFFALGILPWVFWAFTLAVERGCLRDLAGAAAAYAFLILSHNATALLATPLLVAWVLFKVISLGRLVCTLRGAGRAVGAAALGLGLGGFFLVPMLVERRFVVLEQWTSGSYDYALHFVYPSQLLSPFWGFGYAGPGTADRMSFQLGLVPAFGFLVACIWGWRRRPRGDLAFFTAATLLIVFLMMPASMGLWELLPLAALIQFPWRLLALTALTLAAACAAVPAALTAGGKDPPRGTQRDIEKKNLRASAAQEGVVLALALAATVLASLPYAKPEHTPRDPRAEQPVAVIDFETFHPPDRVGMTVWVEEQPHDSPLVAQYLAGQPLQKVRLVRGMGEAQTLRHGAASELALVRAEGAATVQFLTYYFPGWRAWVDGVEVPVRAEGPQGLITLEVPAGEHQVMLRFMDTPARQAGLALSALSALAWLALLAVEGWKRGGVRHALP